MARMQDRTVLVTGAAGGIGKAITAACLAEGARVVATDLHPAQAVPGDERIVWAQHDVRSESEWGRAINSAQEKFGRLDCVINNAGLSTLDGPQDPENISLEHWRAVQAINVEGVLLGCKYAIQAMKATGGAIVNISSIAGLRPSFMCAYGASKAAVRHLTRSVALYCMQRGYAIRCNSVHPGFIVTPMLRASLSPQALEEQKNGIPMHRFGRPEEIAAAVIYLCSEESAYVTGTRLVVDGGILMD